MDTISKDLQYVWHPCSHLKDFEQTPPLVIQRAQDCFLYTESGQGLIDATSSWWCKSLGHGHPRLIAALIDQANHYEHAIFANTTNSHTAELSEKLASLRPGLGHVLFASDGSSVVDMSLKLSLHAQKLSGNLGRNQFATLKNSYHGETGLALSVSDMGQYRDVYQDILITPTILSSLPYCPNERSPTWQDCATIWPQIVAQLDANADSLAAIIIEPILQGAGHMQLYSPDLLQRLCRWAKPRGIYIIVDEILTGFGRLGQPLACDIANITPDFICLGKGLTAGYLPLSALLVSDDIHRLFTTDERSHHDFLHSHTHSGNALATRVALEALTLYEEENIYHKIQSQSHYLYQALDNIASKTGLLTNVRGHGWMVAADIRTEQARAGFAVYQQALRLGALLRPLGNTLYWLPPFTMTTDLIDTLAEITLAALLASDLVPAAT